jgi:hypothetical protein
VDLMAISRIEIAIECDEPLEEGIEALAVMVEALGLSVERDVEVILTPGVDGTPILMAILVHNDDADEGNHDDSSGL